MPKWKADRIIEERKRKRGNDRKADSTTSQSSSASSTPSQQDRQYQRSYGTTTPTFRERKKEEEQKQKQPSEKAKRVAQTAEQMQAERQAENTARRTDVNANLKQEMKAQAKKTNKKLVQDIDNAVNFYGQDIDKKDLTKARQNQKSGIKSRNDTLKSKGYDVKESSTGQAIESALKKVAGGHLKAWGNDGNELSMYKDILDNGVANGKFTQEEADRAYEAFKQSSKRYSRYEGWEDTKSHKALQKMYKKGEKLYDEGEQEFEKAREGAGMLKRAYLGAIDSGIGMATDMLAGPAWFVSMLSRTYGSELGRAQKEGATKLEDERNAGLQAYKEIGTELMFRGGGIAKAMRRGKGFSLADAFGKRAGKNVTESGIKSALKRYGWGIAEENLEEVAAWGVEPLIENWAYKDPIWARRTAQTQKSTQSEGDELRNMVSTLDEHQVSALAAHLNSDDYINEVKQELMSNGSSDEEATEFAETLQGYFNAVLSNNKEEEQAYEDSLVGLMMGEQNRSTHSGSELAETLLSTTMLTGVTGVAGTITTAARGNAIKNKNGIGFVKDMAQRLKNYDVENSAEGQAVTDHIDNGKDVTGTQVDEIANKFMKVEAERNERYNTGEQVKARGMKREGLLVQPRQANPDGTFSLGKITDQAYDSYMDEALDYIVKSGLDVSTEDAQVIADAYGAYMTGNINTDQMEVLNTDNAAARTVFSELADVNFNDYTVKDRNGNIDTARTNIAMENGLYAKAADHYLGYARIEQQNWNDEARGEVQSQMSPKLGGNGDVEVSEALKTVDPRDKGRYMLTAEAANRVYTDARMTTDTWEDVRQSYNQMFKGVDESVMRKVFESAKTDKEIAETTNYGKKVERNSVTNEQVRVPGKVIDLRQGDKRLSDIEFFQEAARTFGVDIEIVDDLPMMVNGEIVLDDNGMPIQVEGEQVGNTIRLNTHVDIKRNIRDVVEHELIHQIRTNAPDTFRQMANYLMNEIYKSNPEGFTEAIRRKQAQYAKTKEGGEFSVEMAFEEMLANGFVGINWEQLIEDAKTDPAIENKTTFFENIKAAFAELLRKLRAILSSGNITSDAARQATMDEILKAGDTYNMLVKAARDARVTVADQAINTKQDDINMRSMSDSRWSLIADMQYNNAVKKDDMVTAQKLVDQAAERAGLHVVHMYHGTTNYGFTEFDKSKAQVNGDSGAGFYFTTENADSTVNYANIEGGDNYFKWSNLADDIWETGISPDGEDIGDQIKTYEDAEKYAKDYLNKNPGVYNVYLDYKNPYIRNGRNSTNIYDAIMAGYDNSMPRIYYLEDAIDDAFTKAIAQLKRNYTIEEMPAKRGIINKILNYASKDKMLTWDVIENCIFTSGDVQLTRDEWGDSGYGVTELTRAVVESFGYDAVHDKEVAKKFGAVPKAEGAEHIIVFKPEQIKDSSPVTYDDTGDMIPLSQRFDTTKTDMRFSLSEPVERVKNLIAVHNFKTDDARNAFDLGGLAMPSIAVTKDSMGHDMYGDITLMFHSDTIDPEFFRSNQVFGGDAYTPTFPAIEHKPNEDIVDAFRDIYYDNLKTLGYDAMRPFYELAEDAENALNKNGGERGLIDSYKNDVRAMRTFLKMNGQDVENVVKRTEDTISETEQKLRQHFIDALGEDAIREFEGEAIPNGKAKIDHRKNWTADHKDEIKSAYKDFLSKEFSFSEEEINNVLDNMSLFETMKLVRNALNYLNNGATTVTEEVDRAATDKAVEDAAHELGYEEWIESLLTGIEEKRGIRNSKDFFTRNGNRRSWDSLHDDITLENVVKAMKSELAAGGNGLLWKNPKGAAQKSYKSLDEIRADEDRLQQLPEEEYKALEQAATQKLSDVLSDVVDNNPGRFSNKFGAVLDAGEYIAEILNETRDKSAMQRKLKKDYWLDVTDEQMDRIAEAIDEIANLPTGYFEAKPRRAVGFDEVRAAVIPANLGEDVKQGFSDRGITMYEYDPDVEGDRTRAINEAADAQDIRFSIAPSLDNDLQAVLDDTFNSANGEVLIGNTSDFMVNIMGADPLLVTMPANKAYRAMVTEDEAKKAGRYNPARSDEDNYHGLGKQGLINALKASENPIVAFASKPDYNRGDRRYGHIILVTDQIDADGNNVVIVQRVDSKGRINRRRVTVNKIITAYGRNYLEGQIQDAYADNRLLYVDKKRSHTVSGGTNKRLVSGRNIDFKNNIDNFWANVNYEKFQGRYSLSNDSEGSALSYGQDTFFANSKNRDADGRLRVMLHGTNADFTEFDPSKANNGTLGRAFYFSDSASHAGHYGNVGRYYLNLENPLIADSDSHDITKEQLRRFVAYLAADEDYGIENYGADATIDSVTDSLWGKTDFAMMRDLNLSAVGDFAQALKDFNRVNGTNYDGIITNTETVAFYPQQIKRTDNLNPTLSKDTRYSIADSKGRELTDGQVEYFKDSKARDDQGRLVPVYHTTNKGGFTIFDPMRSDDHRSLFFSDSWDVSQTYGENAEDAIDLENAGFKSWESFEQYALANFANYPGWDSTKSVAENLKVEITPNKPKAIDTTFEKWLKMSDKNKNYHIEMKIPTETGSEYYMFADSQAELLRDISTTFGKKFNQKGYYAVYLNLENPLIVDANYNEWTRIPFSTRIGDSVLREDTYDTREISEIAQYAGYDGVIIKNVVDIGEYGYSRKASDVYVAFLSNQIKDINNENPTENPDIRYSIVDNDEAMSHMAHDYAYDNSYEALNYYEKILEAAAVSNEDALYDRAKSYVENDVDEFYAGLTKYADGMVFEDPVLEEGRVRMAKSKIDYFNSNVAKWNDKWLTEGEVLDPKSIKKPVRELVMGVMQESDTKSKYKSDLVNKTIIDMRLAYMYAKRGRTDVADALLWHSAHRMIDGVEFYADDSTYEQYKGLRDYLKNTRIQLGEEYWSDVDYCAFRKANFGRLNLVKGTTNVDQIYQELEEMFPGLFDSEEYTTPPDQLMHLSEVLDSIQPYKEAYDSEQAAEIATDIAADLVDIMQNGKELQSTADKYKNRYEAHVRAMKTRHAEAMLRVRQQRDNAVKAEKAKFKAYVEKKREKQYHDKHFKSIEASHKKLTERLLTNTADSNIPEQYKKELAKLLGAFDLQKVGSKAWEARTGRTSQAHIKMAALQIALGKIEASTSEFYVADAITDIMDELLGKDAGSGHNRSIEGLTIDELNSSELAKIDDLLKALVHEFNTYKTVKIQAKRQQVSDIGKAQVNSALEYAAILGRSKDYQNGLGVIDRIINMGELTPAYLFRRIDPNNEGMGLMWKELRRSFDRYVRNQNQLNDWMDDIVGKYHQKGILWNKYGAGELSDWRNANHARTFNLTNGAVTLTPAQMMSLYCLSKRAQAYNHMTGAGIVAAPVTFLAKVTSDIRKEADQSISVKLEDSDIKLIVDQLTPEQMEVADKLQELMATKMAAWGNEASMNVLGIELFKDPDYFPIKSDRAALETDLKEDQFENAIRNFGFAKAVQPDARNAIMVDDIFDVVAEHCNNMNLYNSYSEALNDFMKVFNYRDIYDDNGKTREITVKQAIAHAYSKKATRYILQFIKDLNGNVSGRSDAIENAYNATLANAKKAAVFANLRVAAQQPTAIVRAFAVIDPKYMKGVKIAPGAMKEMFEHCPIALWKSWGNYDINMGKSVEDLMMNNGKWLEDKATELYGALDNVTWTAIWQMVKAEMKDTHPDVKVGTDEYWDLCNERMSEIVDFTQVVDSPMHRSHDMRSKNVVTKLATAFMAEPTLTFNMVRDGWIRARDEYKAGSTKKAFGIAQRTFNVFLLQAATVAAAAALIDALRRKKPDKDDEDESFLHLWWVNFLNNFHNEGFATPGELYRDKLKSLKYSVNFLDKIYFIKDIKSLMEGWENSNLALQGWKDIATGWNQLTGNTYVKSKKTWYENMASGLGYLTGVPAKTMMTGISNFLAMTGISIPAIDAVKSNLDALPDTINQNNETEIEPESMAGKLLDITLSDDKSLMDRIAEKMGYRPIGSNQVAAASDTTPEADTEEDRKAKLQEYEDSLSDEYSDDQKKKLVKQYEKTLDAQGTKTASVDMNSEELQAHIKQGLTNFEYEMEKRSLKAAENAAGLEGNARNTALWDVISDGYTKSVASGNLATIQAMKDAFVENGGDADWFDAKIVEKMKTEYKKTIYSDEIVPGASVRQDHMRAYMKEHGVTDEEISEIVRKTSTARDLKAAMRLGNEEYIMNELMPLIHAGLTREDYEYIYKYRNYGAKDYDGKYTDPEYTKTTGTFIWPTEGTITSHFGYRGYVGPGASTNHPAIDIGAPEGTAVVAADGGVVIYAGWNGGYGNSVGIKHANGMVTYYNHLSGWNVNVGDQVGQGQQIAQVGNTGTSFGAHLDFKILDIDGNPVDPEQYLNKRN